MMEIDFNGKIIKTVQTSEGTLRFFDTILSINPRCEGFCKSGRPCDRMATVKLNNKHLCTRHTSKNIKKLIEEFLLEREDFKNGIFNHFSQKAETKIKEIYDRAAPYRRVPPSEYIGISLLRELQEERCLMCLAMGINNSAKNQKLLEDHDHGTGMVRALLCRDCNVMEGSGRNKLPWDTYRKYAPGNGLYIRYAGWGRQWEEGCPDPLPNRFKLSVECNSNDAINYYKHSINYMPPTEIPNTCNRRFDAKHRPILLDGERYAEKDDPEFYTEWQIVNGI